MNQVTATSTAAVNDVFMFIIGISVILLLGVTFAMLYFVIKYNRKRHPKAVQIEGSVPLEIIWTVVPTILVLFMFYYGFEGFKLLRNVPDDAMIIKVTGRMWDWGYEYENGVRTDQMFVPVDRPIKVLLKSVDVLHSFYIPAFRVKEDAVPGKENYLWFKPQSTGPADIYCAEYCGQRHAYMMSKVIVMTQEDFDTWYQEAASSEGKTLAEKALNIMENFGCTGCHSLDGTSVEDAPTFKGIMGRTTVIVEGDAEKELTIDEDYLFESIRNPGKALVKGYEDIMSPDEDLSDDDIKTIIEYLKTVK